MEVGTVWYEGEWIIGTDIREGKGIEVDLEGTYLFHGYFKNNEKEGRGLELFEES